jgi:putative salt-induced outer membrane protein
MLWRPVLFSLATLICTSPTLASWQGRGELGLVFTSGNTDTDSGNFKFDLLQDLNRWKHEFGIVALRSTTDDVTNAQRYQARLQANYGAKEGGRNFWFAGLRYDDDRFSGFEYQASFSTGYRRQVIDGTNTKLSAQIGAGYRRLESSLTGETDADAISRADVSFEHGLTQTTKVINLFTSEAGAENVFVENQLSLQVAINDSFALAIGTSLRYNSDPPEELESTDTLTTANLVYSF